MTTFSPQSPRGTAESFRKLLDTFTKARQLFQASFAKKMRQLPEDLRDALAVLVGALRDASEADENESPATTDEDRELKMYYRRSARIFHPDVLPVDLKEEGGACFAKVGEYYTGGNIAGLQAITLSWIAEHFDSCDESARAFFGEQSRIINDRFSEISGEATRLIWSSYELETVSCIAFEDYIRTQILLLRQELLRQQATKGPEVLSLPPRPE